MERVFSINQASELLGVSHTTVRRMIKNGLIDHYAYAGTSIIRLSESHIRSYLDKSKMYTPTRRDARMGENRSLKCWKSENNELDVKTLFKEVYVKKCR